MGNKKNKNIYIYISDYPTFAMQFGGNVDDQTHSVEQAAKSQNENGADATNGEYQGKNCQKQAMAM